MRPGGGKQKGASFEREVCVMLSKWISNDVSSAVFWRSAMSGGRATIAYKSSGALHGSQVGDISCISPIGGKFIDNFAVEVKFYANLDYQGLLTGKGKLLAFWVEINKQAARYSKSPFLVARQNRMPANVCLDNEGMSKLGLRDSDTSLISNPHDLYLIDAEHFFKVCKPYVLDRRRSTLQRSGN